MIVKNFEAHTHSNDSISMIGLKMFSGIIYDKNETTHVKPDKHFYLRET